ncbi:STAS domain-containing protein [Lentzea sp. BCCO 10_0061]|uniref:STAS domain-containing protein n=1 Tax=Lentzea sokolovensis TaxID=3095429 RepID=A0ABU4URC0_9PSEU|nr:STAS domain-containing protein [Lentzea sp. BCCO 10_0061]MDX8141825.1 STAS domain-containing protein [Lentzea sp. BCCO 10_0061]
MTAFTVVTRDTPAGPVLELAGDLDSATAPLALQSVEALTPRPGQQVVVDLTELRFCDSSGISALIATHNLAHAADAGIALAGVPRHLTRTLALVGLGGFFVTHPTAAQAQAAWADPPGE